MAGLYIHIPYCTVKCAYCDFYSGPLRGFEAEAYVGAALTELQARRHEVTRSEDELFSTVYIGGGTPSAIAPSLLSVFCSMAAPDAEITIESNPEDVTELWADEAMKAGFNRVSMGVQSLADGELRSVGRRHTAAQALQAVKTLRQSGFSNISLDLIYGLPEQDLQSWKDSLDGVLDLHTPHLSAYLLSYEPGTRLYTRLMAGKTKEASEELITQMYEYLCEATRKNGLEHYEISNFASPGMRSRHNSSYWDFTPYLGIGPGAHSFDGQTRRFNHADFNAYMKDPAGFTTAEPFEPNAIHNDMVITSLRTADGFDPAILSAKESADAKRLLEMTDHGRWRIAESDWLLSNSLMEPFIRVD